MKLTLVRFSTGIDDTLGLLFLDGKFFCYTLEDEKRTVKKYGETRIPNGIYDLQLRKFGSWHDRNKNIFGFNDGTIELLNVPNFKDILIHWGNDDDDTSGCILVGETQKTNRIDNGFIGSSRDAYKALYPVVAERLRKGYKVRIEVTDDISNHFNREIK